MIQQETSAVLLVLPLICLILQSIRYWKDYIESNRTKGKPTAKAKYPQPFFALLVCGVMFMWFFWLSGIVLQYFKAYFKIFSFFTYKAAQPFLIQIIGFTLFFIGAFLYNWSLYTAGRNLRPAPSGNYESHQLIQSGPYRIIRHPLYGSYVLILAGIILILLTFWLIIPLVCLLIGIYPTAKAEELMLIHQFGDA